MEHILSEDLPWAGHWVRGIHHRHHHHRGQCLLSTDRVPGARPSFRRPAFIYTCIASWPPLPSLSCSSGTTASGSFCRFFSSLGPGNVFTLRDLGASSLHAPPGTSPSDRRPGPPHARLLRSSSPRGWFAVWFRSAAGLRERGTKSSRAAFASVSARWPRKRAAQTWRCRSVTDGGSQLLPLWAQRHGHGHGHIPAAR